MAELDWRDYNWYPSKSPCCICGTTFNTGTEPRFGYTVCEKHSKVSPNTIWNIQKEDLKDVS